MGSTNKLIVAMLGVAVLAGAFWMLAAKPEAPGSERARPSR